MDESCLTRPDLHQWIQKCHWPEFGCSMWVLRGCPAPVTSFMCVIWLIHICDMTHSCVWHESFKWVPWLIPVCDMTHSYEWHDSFPCVTWLIHMIDLTHSFMWHDSFICVQWLIHMCDMTHSYVRHDSLIFVTWLTHMWHDSLICVTRLTHTATSGGNSFAPWLIDMCDTIHVYVPHDSLICVIWLIHTTTGGGNSFVFVWPRLWVRDYIHIWGYIEMHIYMWREFFRFGPAYGFVTFAPHYMAH